MSQNPDNAFVCRCEDVTVGDIKELIHKGINTIDELKRISRCGMGPCGGKTCNSILIGILARETNTPPSEIKQPTYRPPVKNITLGQLAKEGDKK